jgi:hypothetical protein
VTETVALTQTTTTTADPMKAHTRRLIGAVNVIQAALAFSWLVAAYGLAERLVADQERAAEGTIATRSVGWPGLHVAVTLNMSLLIVGAAAGAVGSVVHQGVVYAHARHDDLEIDHLSWYVLRPVWSALLGAVMVLSVNTGLISIGDETTSTAGVAVLVTMGALAGLYTDQALKRLKLLIGMSASRGANTPPS